MSAAAGGRPAARGRGVATLDAHVECVRQFGVPLLVGINRYPTDTEREYRPVIDHCARLREADVSELERHPGGEHRVAAVCDVPEGTAVDERRRPLQRLRQVRVDRVAQQRRHGARHPEGVGRHRPAVSRVGDDHAPEPLAEIRQALGQAEHGHDLGGGGDEEPALARDAVRSAAEAQHDVAERPVVHVERALPEDLLRVDAKVVAVMEAAVQHCRQQVVRGCDGMEVAREVEVDPVHGHDLGAAAPGAPALEPEHGADGRLAERHHRARSRPTERLGQADGHRGLAVPRRRRRDGGHHHELAVGTRAAGLERREEHLGHIPPVRHPFGLGEAEVPRQVRDGARKARGESGPGRGRHRA